MAGNAVLLKPSEVTPYSGRLVADLFEAAGLPEGLLSVLLGDGETGQALTEVGVDKISFTGSVETGRKVAEACARQLLPCTLELGGKDPMIVCSDADIERASAGALFGAFMNTGQVCCSIERVYVVDEVADEFIAKVLEKTQALRQGANGEADMGTLCWPDQLEVIERHIADAKAKGAKVLAGGRRNPNIEPSCNNVDQEPCEAASHNQNNTNEDAFPNRESTLINTYARWTDNCPRLAHGNRHKPYSRASASAGQLFLAGKIGVKRGARFQSPVILQLPGPIAANQARVAYF